MLYTGSITIIFVYTFTWPQVLFWIFLLQHEHATHYPFFAFIKLNPMRIFVKVFVGLFSIYPGLCSLLQADHTLKICAWSSQYYLWRKCISVQTYSCRKHLMELIYTHEMEFSSAQDQGGCRTWENSLTSKRYDLLFSKMVPPSE